MTTHLVRLQFAAGGPTVTGDWADGATARRAWRDWVGLFGSDEKVVVRLAEDADGAERVLMAWERGNAVETGSDGPAATEGAGLPGCRRPRKWPTAVLSCPTDRRTAAERINGLYERVLAPRTRATAS
ncbi:hypothetical protein [Streptomyces sp. NPDC001450]